MLPLFVWMAASLSPSMPEAEVTEVDSDLHQFLGRAQGRPMVFVFISHDCPICNSYAPEIARMAKLYGAKTLFGLVYEDRGLSPAAIRSHARAFGLQRANLYLDRNGAFAAFGRVTTVPEAAVYHPKGQTSYLETYRGRIDDLYYDFGKRRRAAAHHDLRNAIEATLANKRAKPASGPPIGCVIEASSKP